MAICDFPDMYAWSPRATGKSLMAMLQPLHNQPVVEEATRGHSTHLYGEKYVPMGDSKIN